jgi:GH24 family phage-related lysozyme (muramidase)
MPMTSTFATPVRTGRQPLPVVARTAARQPDGKPHVGNQTVLRRLSAVAPRLQARLEIGAVDDPLEHEADAVADAVMGMAEPGPLHAAPPQVSRKCAACEEEDKNQTLQTKPDSAVSARPVTAPQQVYDVIGQSGRALDVPTRAFFEPRFGVDLSAVRVHAEGHAGEAARKVGARAFAVGQHIVFAPGAFAPASASGRHLLAHELAHVVQQQAAAPYVARQPGRDVAGNAEEAQARPAEASDGGESATPQPTAAGSAECLDRCEQQFKDCTARGEPMSCLAARTACLRGCEPPSPEKPAPAPAPAPPSGPATKSAPYTLSDTGKAFIKSPLIEGFCPNLYDDDTVGCGRNPKGSGNCTIFFGQLVHLGPCKPDDVPPPDKSEARFADATKIVNDYVTVELSQNQVDALVSFTFNANVGGMKVLAPTLNAGDLAAMPDLIRKTKTNNGVLVPRRNREANLFASGDYQPKK